LARVSAIRVERLARDDAEDGELAAFFEACPTSFAQQTPAWRDALLELGVDEPLFLGARREGRLVGVLPAWRFEGPLGAILTSAAQAGALGGVACLPREDPGPVYAALLGAFRELAAERGCALASVLTNPFWPDAELCERHLEPAFVLENACEVLDLEAALDPAGEPRAAGENLRRNLRRALAGRLLVDEAQTRENVAAWTALHAARQREIGVPPLPEKLCYAALEHAVPRGKARFVFVRLADEGTLVAGGLYLLHGQVMDALMPAVASAHARLAPGYLLALHTLRLARARGLRLYNWQASPPGGGVRRFKLQWGSREARYRYLTRVTGDARAFLAGPVAAVRAGYPWHYALPYDRIGVAGAEPAGPSSRASAWAAGEARRG
jgi:hypothetical protein